jgi:branched-chain amino acid transport system permease protein
VTLLVSTTVSAVLLGGLYALLASGFHLALGVVNVVNFAYGILVVSGSYATFELNSELGLDPVVAAVLVTPAFYVVGLALAPLLIAASDHTFQLIATFAVALVLEGVLLTIFGPDVTGIQTSYRGSAIHVGDVSISVARLGIGVAGIALVAALGLYLQRTHGGRAMRAIAQNARGAEVVGVSVRRVSARVIGLSTAIAGLAGALTSIYLPFSPFAGFELLIIAFIVTALGGLGSLAGLAIAALLVALVETYSSTYLPSVVYQPLIYVVLIAVLWLRPQGIRGRRAVV